jgi:hypothetical protein
VVLGRRCGDSSGSGVVAYRTPGPAGELPACRRRAAHDLGDVVEREAEHVMQHERRALGRRQPVEDDGQRDLQLLVERHPVDRIDRRSRPHRDPAGRRPAGIVQIRRRLVT